MEREILVFLELFEGEGVKLRPLFMQALYRVRVLNYHRVG